MNYFEQYEKIKDLRKEVPTNSTWRYSNDLFEPGIRYKVIRTMPHNNTPYDTTLMVRYRAIDLMDESYSGIGIVSLPNFIISLVREN